MDRQFEDRLATVERALTDGETDLEAVTEGAATAEQVADLEDRLETIEDEVADLDAATQALRGYVGEVRSVNESIEETAATAMAKAEEAQSAAETRSAETRSGGSLSGTSQTGARSDESAHPSGTGDDPGQDRPRDSGHSGSTSIESEHVTGQDDEGCVAGATNSSPSVGGTGGPVSNHDREAGDAVGASRTTGAPTRNGRARSRPATGACPTCGRDGGEGRAVTGGDDETGVGDSTASGGRQRQGDGGGTASRPRAAGPGARVPEPAHRADPEGTGGRPPARGRSADGRESRDAGLLSWIHERL